MWAGPPPRLVSSTLSEWNGRRSLVMPRWAYTIANNIVWHCVSKIWLSRGRFTCGGGRGERRIYLSPTERPGVRLQSIALSAMNVVLSAYHTMRVDGVAVLATRYSYWLIYMVFHTLIKF